MSGRLSPDFERTLRRYVLGGLDEPLRIELEETLVSDPGAFEALGVVEDELVEEYLDGALDVSERAALERSFLTSAAREARLRFAQALRDRTRRGAAGEASRSAAIPASRSTRAHPAWLAVAAALAFSLAGNVWLATRGVRPEGVPLPAAAEAGSPVAAAPTPVPGDSGALAREQAARTRAESNAARLELELARARSSVVTLALSAGRLRAAGDSARITLGAGAVAVRLRLELASAEYASYRAALVDQDGGEIWTATRLEPVREGDDSVVNLVLPAGLLPPGDYEIALSGSQGGGEPVPAGRYAFRVAGR